MQIKREPWNRINRDMWVFRETDSSEEYLRWFRKFIFNIKLKPLKCFQNFFPFEFYNEISSAFFLSSLDTSSISLSHNPIRFVFVNICK